MAEIKFSGELAKVAHPMLKQQFGGAVPIEAADLLFDGDPTMTLGEARERLAGMAAAWDAIAVHFTRLDRAIGRMSNVLSHQRQHLGVMRDETGNENWGLQSVIDAAEVMEAAADDLDAIFREDEC